MSRPLAVAFLTLGEMNVIYFIKMFLDKYRCPHQNKSMTFIIYDLRKTFLILVIIV